MTLAVLPGSGRGGLWENQGKPRANFNKTQKETRKRVSHQQTTITSKSGKNEQQDFVQNMNI